MAKTKTKLIKKKKLIHKHKDEADLFWEELSEDVVTPQELTEKDIESKYDNSQSRIYIRNDFLTPICWKWSKSVIFWISPHISEKEPLNDKMSHLIESLLINVPIPPIFLYESQIWQSMKLQMDNSV
ncbi:MAG: hypothetical protein R3C45_08680 [Phycisphaerales bacterium]